MSNQDWNTKQTTTQLERLALQNPVQVYIPDEVRDKIKFLCKNIAKDEWSGILFYTIEGSIKNVSKMKITLRDILLMDRGNATYTSFDWDEDVVNYQIDNPEAEDWSLGHIHSHNTMGVFFSPTDWSELNDNCPLHNIYLSVIVNNYFDVVGKIAFTGVSQSYTCKDEKGKDYVLKISNSTKSPTMLVYDCNFHYDSPELTVPTVFMDRIKEVEQKVAAKKAQVVQTYTPTVTYPVDKSNIKNPALAEKFATIDLRNKKKEKFPGYEGSKHNKIYNNFQKEFKEELDMFLIEGEKEFTQQTIEQEFATYILRLGNNEDIVDDELEDALADIEEEKLNIASLTTSITDSYGALFDRFFEKCPKYHSDEAFLEVLDGVINALKEHEFSYSFVDVITGGLSMLGNKFESFMQKQQHESATQ